jgi:hypothetical protein
MSKFNTLYNQILSEQDYDRSQFDPRQNTADSSNRRVADYSEPKDNLNDLRNRERNAGVEETPASFKSSSYKYKIGDVYEKHGQKYIIARSPYTKKIGPQLVNIQKGEDLEDGRYSVVYKATGVDEKGYPVYEPTGEKRKLREPTQWGVKDVPGGDID